MLKLIFALVLLALPVSAQSWTAETPFDTGWFDPAMAECQPLVQEPETWSAPQVVPAPPPGAYMVRTAITSVEYRNTITATNNSGWDTFYRVQPTYSYRVGHIGGIYHSNYHIYATGHGYDDATHWYVTGLSAGTPFSTRNLDAGESREDAFFTAFNTATFDLQPITTEWLASSRRGQHALFVTSQGAYNWSWGWQETPPPGGWGSHSPISYGMTPEVRLRGAVRYALP